MKRLVLLFLMAACAKDPLADKAFECDPAARDPCGPGYVCVEAPAGADYAWWCRPLAEETDAATDTSGSDAAVPPACRMDGDCDDSDPCTDDSCDPVAGCVHAPNQATCDDGNPCTEGDRCVQGTCAGIPDPDCQCEEDADCLPLEDGNRCNGTLRCDGHSCEVDPATVVAECPDSGQACTRSECNPASGLCEPVILPDDTPCNDHNACSGPDVCSHGSCVGGPIPPETCNGVDDDCDGFTDEDPVDAKRSGCPKDGVCGKDGMSLAARCVDGTWVCDLAGLPGYEAHPEASCDDLDNDCDGFTDEDFEYSDEVHPEKVHKGAGCGPGDCASGTVACRPDHSGLYCDTSTATKPEVCDGLDNDCDGLADEGFSYQGTPVWKDSADISLGPNACTGIGECGTGAPGIVECQGLDGAGCSTNPGGSHRRDVPETCNGRDDDCDGLTDDGPMADDDPCLAVGVCDTPAVVAECSGGNWICIYDAVPGFEPGTEAMCDGKDNDCDGATDEDFQFDDLGTIRMKGDSCGTGVCAAGHVTCRADGAGLLCDTASEAGAEACNGKDDDCDGVTDEDADAACGDTLGCTNARCIGGECVHDIASGFCLIGGCVLAGAVDPGNPCSTCDPAVDPTGWTAMPDGTGCDADHDGCTKDDACKSGVCTAGPPVNCSALDEPCRKGLCQSPAGTCAAIPVANGTACSDGDPCTITDECLDGTCKGTTDPCSDGKDCTDDSCDKALGCVHKPKAGWCLIGETCMTATSLNPVNACQECDPAKNAAKWSSRPDKTACDDDDACTTAEACSSGACKGGTPVNCDDGTVCTVDSCDKASGCVHSNADGVACTDNNACTTGDVCTGGTCKGTPKDCSDGRECTDDACDGTGKCTNTLKSNWCLIGGATCFASAALNPANTCQTCDPAKSTAAWSTLADASTCNDGDACTTGDACKSGACKGPTSVDCNDNNPCTADSCDKVKGCQHPKVPDGTACDNGISCDKNDHCAAGKCIGENLPPEVCHNHEDDDCDGSMDEEGGIGCKTYFNDADKDGWGDDKKTKCLCDPAGTYTVPVGQDCNDGDGGVHPAAIETCNGKDDNCDGEVDEGEAVGCTNWYVDKDLDTYGIPGITLCRCKPEGKFVAVNSTDCADNDSNIHPNAPERCNQIDDDCDLNIDEGADTICGSHLFCESGRCLPPLVTVPAATFWMGANKDGVQCPSNAFDPSANADEVPCHSVSVPEFSIERYEVTVAIFKACVNAGKCVSPTDCGTYATWSKTGKEQHPVNCVSWDQAETFCAWAGRRLCSEAEWELAARGTDGRMYPWGSATASCSQAAMFENGYGCGQNSTLEVGSKADGASPCGALDMAGNVWEWVRDWHHATYAGAPTNGTAWEMPATSNRVMRGGSFYSDSYYVRASVRDLAAPTARSDSVGFRCCR